MELCIFINNFKIAIYKIEMYYLNIFINYQLKIIVSSFNSNSP